MRIDFEHPVIVRKPSTQGGAADRLLLRTTTPLEIAEYGSDDVPVAMLVTSPRHRGGPMSIRHRDGKLYKRVTGLDDQSLQPGSRFHRWLIGGTKQSPIADFQPFWKEVWQTARDNRFEPAMMTLLHGTENTGKDREIGLSSIAKLCLTERFYGRTREKLGREAEEDVAAWGVKLHVLMANVIFIDGVAHHRCNEPLYATWDNDYCELSVNDGAIHQFEVHRKHYEPDGRETPGEQWTWKEAQMFSALQRDEALEFSSSIRTKRMRRARIPEMIEIIDPSAVSTDVTDREINRFAAIAIDHVEKLEVNKGYRADPMLDDLIAAREELRRLVVAAQDGADSMTDIVDTLSAMLVTSEERYGNENRNFGAVSMRNFLTRVEQRPIPIEPAAPIFR